MATATNAATITTDNFIIQASDTETARQVAISAETARDDLAELWLGETLPKWTHRCSVTVRVGQLGAGGSTTYSINKGDIASWNMKVQGSLERIVDSVIPHEVTHMVLASHFRRHIPRWADEGASVLSEHLSERCRYTKVMICTNRRISLDNLLSAKEYPADATDRILMYSEGYLFVKYLMQIHEDDNHARFMVFVADSYESNWEESLRKHYGFESLRAAEVAWREWLIHHVDH